MYIQEEEEREFHVSSTQEIIEYGIFAAAHPDEELCGCHGRGWMLSPLDTWHECPCHRGREHPETEEE